MERNSQKPRNRQYDTTCYLTPPPHTHTFNWKFASEMANITIKTRPREIISAPQQHRMLMLEKGQKCKLFWVVWGFSSFVIVRNLHLCHNCLCVCPVTDKDAFIIQHSNTNKCLSTGSTGDLTIAPCEPGSRSQQWKWGSGHRLFHVGTSRCLALDVQSKTLSLVECNSAILLWWRCMDGAIYTVYEMALVVTNGTLAAKRDTVDTWVRGGSQDNICQKPYRGECGHFGLALSRTFTECKSLIQPWGRMTA